MKTAAPFGTAASLRNRNRLAERVRNVVEGRAELRADVLHGSDGGNGDQRGDQTVFDRGRALRILQNLDELGHFKSPETLGPYASHQRTNPAQVGSVSRHRWLKKA